MWGQILCPENFLRLHEIHMTSVIVIKILMIRVDPDVAPPDNWGKVLARLDRCQYFLAHDRVF
jgi:hypothetical protein